MDKFAVTDDTGTARFSLKNASVGCYSATLYSVIVPSGYEWPTAGIINTSNSEDKLGGTCP